MEVEDSRITYEELAECHEFETLDSKLSTAIRTIAKGHIGRILTRKTKVAARKMIILSSRQLLRLIYSQYDLDADKGQMYAMEDLMD